MKLIREYFEKRAARAKAKVFAKAELEYNENMERKERLQAIKDGVLEHMEALGWKEIDAKLNCKSKDYQRGQIWFGKGEQLIQATFTSDFTLSFNKPS